MADVFISYARADKERVRVIAHTLEAAGWSVWWDPEIRPHESFHDVIDRELANAKAVLVVWSENSVPSRWVRSEATDGLQRSCLIQVRLDDTRVPRPFDQFQIADLTRWKGDPTNAEWLLVNSSVDALVSGEAERLPVAGKINQPTPYRPAMQRWRAIAGAGALAVGLVIAGIWGYGKIAGSDDDEPVVAEDQQEIGFPPIDGSLDTARAHGILRSAFRDGDAIFYSEDAQGITIVGYEAARCRSTIYVNIDPSYAEGPYTFFSLEIDWRQPFELYISPSSNVVGMENTSAGFISVTPWQRTDDISSFTKRRYDGRWISPLRPDYVGDETGGMDFILATASVRRDFEAAVKELGTKCGGYTPREEEADIADAVAEAVPEIRFPASFPGMDTENLHTQFSGLFRDRSIGGTFAKTPYVGYSAERCQSTFFIKNEDPDEDAPYPLVSLTIDWSRNMAGARQRLDVSRGSRTHWVFLLQTQTEDATIGYSIGAAGQDGALYLDGEYYVPVLFEDDTYIEFEGSSADTQRAFDTISSLANMCGGRVSPT